MIARLTKIKFIEVPKILTPMERQSWINTWVSDMQRNGIAILSINFDHDEELSAIYKIEFIEEVKE